MTYNRSILTIILFSLLSLGTNGQLSGIYTINSASPNIGSNFNSILAAVHALDSAGISSAVTFNIVPNSGPYHGQILIPAITGASSTNTITFNGNNNVISATPQLWYYYIIMLNGANYVTLDSLVIVDSSDTYGYGVHFSGASNNVLSNCIIDFSHIKRHSGQPNTYGVLIGSKTTSSSGNPGGNNSIINNQFVGGSGTGSSFYKAIRIGGNYGNISSNNVISGNIIEDINGTGISLSYASYNTIEHNDISRKNKTGQVSMTGITLSEECEANLIRYNRIHHCHIASAKLQSYFTGISLIDVTASLGNENVIHTNVIHDINTAGNIYGIRMDNSTGVYFLYNTMSFNDRNTLMGDTYGYYQTYSSSGITLANNNISITRGGKGEKYALYFEYSTLPSNIISSDFNNLYINSNGNGSQFVAGTVSANYTSLIDWQGAYSNVYDQNSGSVDSRFIDPFNNNFTPTTPYLDGFAAVVNGVGKDFVLSDRDSVNPDIGAYEFTAPVVEVSLDSILPPSASCAGTQQIKVRIRNLGTDTLDSVKIGWAVNSILQAPMTMTNPIHPQFDAIFNIGNLNISTTQNYDIKAWAYEPNGLIDSCASNDTASIENYRPALNGTYTVGNTGDYSNLVDVVIDLNNRGVCGPVIFNLDSASGPYIGTLNFEEINGASAQNTIVIKGNRAVISDTTAPYSKNHLILLYGTDWLTLDSLYIKPFPFLSVYGILLSNSADHNTISNCYLDFTNSVNSGLFARGAGIASSSSLVEIIGNDTESGNYNTIKHNIIDGGVQNTGIQYGIYLNGTIDTLGNEGNIIQGNTIKNFYNTGIFSSHGDGTLIDGNDIHRQDKSHSVTRSWFEGIYLVRAFNTTIRNNLIHNSHDNFTSAGGAYGIVMNDCGVAGKPNFIYNNLIYKLNDASGYIRGIYNLGTSYTKYYYNTVSIDDTTGSGNQTWGFFTSTSFSDSLFGLEVKNNIIYISRNGSTSRGLYYNGTNVAPDIISDNNVSFHKTIQGQNQCDIFYNGCFNFPIKPSTIDTNSVGSDPQFLDIANNDYTPNSIGADNIGVTIPGISTDIFGNPRDPSNPDPGAIEFTPTPINDSCSNAILLSKNTPYIGSTVSATSDSAGSCVVNNDSSGGVWFQYTSGKAYVLFSLCGSAYDTKMRIFTGTCSNLICVDGNNDSCSTQSQIGICSDSGITYTILVYGHNGSEGEYTINISEVPIVKPTITIQGDTSFCPGDSVVLISSLSHQYLWNDSNAVLARAFTSYGSGSFKVVTTDTNGCHDTSRIVQTQKFQITPATISPNGNIEFCDGDSVLLTAGMNATYLWNDSSNSTSNSIVVKNSGSFQVVTSDANNCFDTSNIVSIIKHLPVPAVVSVSGSLNFCSNDSLELASNLAVSYSWNDASFSTSQHIFVNDSGWYHVTTVDTNSCISISDSVQTSLFLAPLLNLGDDTVICAGIKVLLSSDKDYVKYLWNTGDTTKSIEYVENDTGSYPIELQVIDSNNCSDIDELILKVINCVGIEEGNTLSQVVLFPVPADDYINIDLSMLNENVVELKIINDEGRAVFNKSVRSNGINRIDIVGYPVGVYYLLLRTGESTSVLTFIKK